MVYKNNLVSFTFFIVFSSLLYFAGCSEKKDVSLAPPPDGQGFQLETDSFEVPQGDEIQNCYFFQVPDLSSGDDVYVGKIEAIQNTGSHHMNVFRVKTIVGLGPDGGLIQTSKNGEGECYRSSNWADWPLVYNTQNDSQDLQTWELPSGVAHKFVPGEWLMLQSHYVNANTQKTKFKGHAIVNFWTTPEANVENELGTIFTTKQQIRICEGNPNPKFVGTCNFNKGTENVHVIGANGHFHSRGKEFDMYNWDGTTVYTPSSLPPSTDRFYQSTTWDDPPFTHSPDLDLLVAPGGGVLYTCEYEWQAPPASVGCDTLNEIDAVKNPLETPDCCYTFGGVVEKNEHCNAFVYYYPKIDDATCF